MNQLTLDQMLRMLDEARADEREACALAICSDCQIAMEDGEVQPAVPDAVHPGNWVHPTWDFVAEADFYVPCKAAAIRAREE